MYRCIYIYIYIYIYPPGLGPRPDRLAPPLRSARVRKGI